MYETWDLPDGRRYIGANVDNDISIGTQTSTNPYTKGANAYIRPAITSSNPDELRRDADFVFAVEYSHGQPVRVTVLTCDNNAPVVLIDNQRISAKYDMRIRHQPIWGGQTFTGTFAAGHANEVIDLREEARKNGTLVDYTSTWTPWSNSLGVLAATNYGVNRGAYTTRDGSDVARPDPKQFFILDYPKSVADYAKVDDKPGDTDLWPWIFINPTPPERWSPLPGFETWTWQETQALRHFGMANVLFCDGHIEALGPEDLSATNPLWRNRK
jgi:prepilin-type processing-associated H-X9-DG protein